LNKDIENQFVELINHHQGIVHKVCGMYRRDYNDRKDLFQEIVVQLWRAFPKFRAEAKVSTWIYQIALNVAISDFRKQSRKPINTTLSEGVFNVAEQQYDYEIDERLEVMYRAIDQLSEIEKAIIMLYFEEKQNDEIADIIGITQNNVRVKMTRIREKLRTMMVNSKNDF
jgi:RNA polymerase sigma-70 factor (ECF subfamily)